MQGLIKIAEIFVAEFLLIKYDTLHRIQLCYLYCYLVFITKLYVMKYNCELLFTLYE